MEVGSSLIARTMLVSPATAAVVSVPPPAVVPVPPPVVVVVSPPQPNKASASTISATNSTALDQRSS